MALEKKIVIRATVSKWTCNNFLSYLENNQQNSITKSTNQKISVSDVIVPNLKLVELQLMQIYIAQKENRRNLA